MPVGMNRENWAPSSHDGTDMAVAVVKAKADGSELYLLSLRRSSQRELNAAVKAGKAVKWRTA